MSRLLPVSRQELIRRLGKLGFEGTYPGSGHSYMIKELVKGRVYVTIPNPHHGQDFCVRASSADLKGRRDQPRGVAFSLDAILKPKEPWR